MNNKPEFTEQDLRELLVDNEVLTMTNILLVTRVLMTWIAR